jgi:hypothetical protein
MTEEISVTSASGSRRRWGVWSSHLIEKVSEREQVGRGSFSALRVVFFREITLTQAKQKGV